MKLIVGLGNPGRRYKSTRHNVGFLVVDEMVGEILWEKSGGGELQYFWKEKTEFIKPQTFMNKSGKSVQAVTKKHQNLKMDDIFVIHDDLDIRLGNYKIQKGKGPKDHNGLNSIYASLGTKEFWHVRVGVENRKIGDNTSGEEYVLQEFSNEETKVINDVIGSVVEELNKIANE